MGKRNLKIGNCGTCQYWKEVEYMRLSGKNVCIKISREFNGANEIAEAICFGEGIGGELVTAESYACNLYEASNG